MASQQQGRRPIYQLGVPGSVVQSYHGWPIHTYINLAEYSVVGTTSMCYSRVAKVLYINSGCSGYSVVEAGRGTKVRGKSRGFQKVRTLAECNYCHLKRTPLSTDLSLCINPTFGASRGEKLKAMIAFQQLCLHGKSKKSE